MKLNQKNKINNNILLYHKLFLKLMKGYYYNQFNLQSEDLISQKRNLNFRKKVAVFSHLTPNRTLQGFNFVVKPMKLKILTFFIDLENEL